MLKVSILLEDGTLFEKAYLESKMENIPATLESLLNSLVEKNLSMPKAKIPWSRVEVLPGQEEIWEYSSAEEICQKLNALVVLEGNTWMECYLPKVVVEDQVGFYERECLGKAKRTYAFLPYKDRFVIRAPHDFDRSRYKVYLCLLQALDWKKVQQENGYALVLKNKEGIEEKC